MTADRPKLTLSNKPKSEPKVTEIIEEKTVEPIETSEQQKAEELPKIKVVVYEQQWYLDILNQLKIRCARAFPSKGKPKVALAIGIHKKIAKRLGITEELAGKFCKYYCKTLSYKAIRIDGAIRYSLKGNPKGIVGEPPKKPTNKKPVVEHKKDTEQQQAAN
jgi:hypothetical protein